MYVVIVYESLFGNTREVAEAIRDGIRDAQPDAQVRCVRASEPNLDLAVGADLLIVGAPTHNRGLATAVTRKMAIRAEERVPLAVPGHGAEPAGSGPGVREWFHALPKAAPGSLGAAFDTRVPSRLAGGAAHAISRRLHHRGYQLAAEPAGFITEDVAGPMRDGELARARAWGYRLLR